MNNTDCRFCKTVDDALVLSNAHAYARYDRYPVSAGHMLIVPRRHFENYFDSSDQEKESLWSMVEEAKKHLDHKHSPDGYNVGINIGPAAGQSIMHVHIHLIPRYRGDMVDPKGGVRGVIPEKQKYQLS